MVSGWSPGNVRPVRVHVAFTPGEATRVPTGIVVDVLRATSTIVQALDAGYGAV
jgi:phosphosulfolactate phosphohydrolase-like enzyme